MKQNLIFKNLMTKIKTSDFFVVCKESRIEHNTSFYGCFYIGPFDESLSQTLANDLRRTLLSELTGLAITSIEIEGVLHKFSSIPGMKESVLDLISNFQNIVLKKNNISATKQSKLEKCKTKKTYTGFLAVNGPGVIKARDLKLPSGLQCVDPNQYIATLAQDGILNIKFTINEGKNFIKQKPYNLDVNLLKKRNILMQDLKLRRPAAYLNTKTNKNTNYIFDNPAAAKQREHLVKQSISNTIPLDAVFMPITKINCIVEENKLFTDFSTDLENNTANFQKLDKKLFIGCNIAGKETPATSGVSNNLNTTLAEGWQFLPDGEQDINFADFFLNYTNNSAVTVQQQQNDKTLDGVFLNSENSQFVPTKNLVKLIPWESNTLYFDLVNYGLPEASDKTKSWQPLDHLSAKSAIYTNLLRSSSINNSAKYLFWQLLKNNLKEPSAAAEQQDKINTFLALNKRHLEKKTAATSLILSKYLFPAAAQQLQVLVNNIRQKKQTLKKLGPQTTKNACLKRENLLLEYNKILKLKPLRKKTHVIVEIWTNGSIHPREALYLSFSFLSNIFLKLQTACFGPLLKKQQQQVPSKNSIWPAAAQQREPFLTNDTTSMLTPFKTKFVQAALHQPPKKSKMQSEVYSAKKKVLSKPQTLLNKSAKEKMEQTPAAQQQLEKGYYLSLAAQRLEAPIGVLTISLRVYTALKKEGIFTIEDLIKYTKKDLLKIKNFGVKSLFELETQLSNYGFFLKNE
uniref:DNA-directed RNA polymerase n=1 Tax=Pandorina morum TaxID=33099 RepID=A0A6C0RWB3_PANMO|nr:RNA polymerase subunit alpha [Pandorina morum]